MTEPRVIVALAHEAEDDFIWRQLENLQTIMFSAGPLAAKFSYFAAEGSRARRPLMSTRWSRNPDDLRSLLYHARQDCVCGCYVHIDDVLAEALKETNEGPVQAVVIIGDCFSGDRDAALAHARQLRAAGTRVFVFQQAVNKSAGDNTLKALAEAGGGALITYNPSVEKLANRLPRFFEAIGHYALGGPDARMRSAISRRACSSNRSAPRDERLGPDIWTTWTKRRRMGPIDASAPAPLSRRPE
jgi:hypothetical protein